MPRSAATNAREAWLRALELTASIGKDPTITFPALVERLGQRYGDAPALLSRNENWSYRELARRARTYAQWTLRQRIRPGDVVGVMLPNSPHYLASWLGIVRVGAVAALVNTNLVGEALVRSITSVGARHVLADRSFSDAVAAALSRLDPGIRCWTPDEVEREMDGPPGLLEAAQPTLADRALYIYTSGTTGLPKAASISHLRVMQWTHWFAGMMATGPEDRTYNCLPLYHSIGGIVAVGATLVGGGSVVLRPHFSATRFWDDIVATRSTIFPYIGELCRYLANGPHHPLETRHQLRLCCGSGLGADIWERFQQRFAIPHILEFYAATEGTFSLYNVEGKPGSIGRIPSYLAHRFPVALIRHDASTGEPVRTPDGTCIRCAAGEAGEAIGEIADGGNRFEGYVDKADSERKILRDVFHRGDQWYRTGDLMRRDASGYFHFVDRIGDTFRWKGENVSTTEVASILCATPHVREAVVYGVGIPGTDGRAGMAAIVAEPDFDLAECWGAVVDRLPDYARPLFLRLSKAVETTATFRPMKQQLAREGFDPGASDDPIFFSDRTARTFVPLDAALYRRIVAGEIRL
ncbi:MAG TPA: long-chain-acyl-CoA synthetase [Stellaceae bacterium]|nr:long-chain-acyl-CoA synthetase [Stellaceae bacterium]